MKHTNKSKGLFVISIGLFILTAMAILNHYFFNMPDFVYGIGLGIGFGIGLLGILSMSNKFYKFKNFKLKTLNKSF